MSEARIITISTFRKPWSTIGAANPEQLFWQARELFEMCQARAAAILARTTIETGLLKLAKIECCEKVFGIRMALDTLEARAVLTTEFRKRLLRAINTGNRAAHGQSFGELSDTLYAIEAARALLPILAHSKAAYKEKLVGLLRQETNEQVARVSEKIWPSDAAKASEAKPSDPLADAG